MRRALCLAGVSVLVWLAACTAQPAVATPEEAAAPDAMANHAASPTPTNQETPAATAALQAPQQIISLQNASQVQLLARYGQGALLNVWYVPGVEGMLVQSAHALTLYAREGLQVLGEIPLPHAFRLSPQHTLLAEVDTTGVVNLRSLRDLALLHTLEMGDTGEHFTLQFSPDESLLAVGHFPEFIRQEDASAEQKAIRFYDTQSGALDATLSHGDFSPLPMTVHISPDNHYVISSGVGIRAIWNLDAQTMVHRLSDISVMPKQPFNPASNLFVTTQENHLFLWDPAQGTTFAKFGSGLGFWHLAEWSDDGNYLRLADGAQVRRAQDGKLVAADQAATIAFTPDALSPALYTGLFASELAQLSAMGFVGMPQRAELWAEPNSVGAWLLMQPDTAQALPGPDGLPLWLSLWQPQHDAVQPYPAALGPRTALAPAAGLLATCLEQAVVVSTSTGQELARMGRCDERSILALSPDGQQLAVGHQVIELYDAHSGASLGTLRAHAYPLEQIAFSPDGRRLASLGQIYTQREVFGGNYRIDTELFIWSLEQPLQQLYALDGIFGLVQQIVFSADASHLFAGEGERLRIWRLTDGEKLNDFAHSAAISSLALSPQQSGLIALGGVDGRLALWDWPTQQLLYAWQAHIGSAPDLFWYERVRVPRPLPLQLPVLALQFAAGGQALYSAGADGTLGVWGIP